MKFRPLLPAVVGKGLVGLRHAMGVFALSHGSATVFGRVHELMREAVRHGLLAALTRRIEYPAHSQCLAASGANFNGYLISRTANAARFHFYRGLDVVKPTV